MIFDKCIRIIYLLCIVKVSLFINYFILFRKYLLCINYTNQVLRRIQGMALGLKKILIYFI